MSAAFKDWLLGLTTANTPAVGDYVPIVQNGVTKKADASGLGSGGGGGSDTFAGLVDVAITSPADWDVVRYDANSGRQINDQLDDHPTILNLTSTQSTLVSQVAGLGALGGVVGESHSTVTVSNTVASASLKSFAANPAVPLAEGDTIIGTFTGSLFNTSGASHTITPIWKVAAVNLHTDDAAFPFTIPSVANNTRTWIFQFELRIGSTTLNHRQSSAWFVTKASGGAASTTTGANTWLPMETNFPMVSMHASTGSEIGSTLPFIELRTGFDVALTTLSMSCHFAQIALIKKP
jgi:hypothetical protein